MTDEWKLPDSLVEDPKWKVDNSLLKAYRRADNALREATPDGVVDIDFYARVVLIMAYEKLTSGLSRADGLSNIKLFQSHFKEIDARINSAMPDRQSDRIH